MSERISLEKRWGLALENAKFAVWDLDVAQQVVHYSPQWKAMLGYDATDEPDATSTWRKRVHPDDLDGMLSSLSAYLAGRQQAYEFEFRMLAADGEFRWVLSRGRIVERDASGQPTRVIGTLTDTTVRREAEALRVQRDRAEASSHAKTEFLSRISHELRTPLNAVLGFAQLLAQQIGEANADLEAQRSHVKQIERAGWHLLTMIEDVLDLSRVGAGQMPIASRVVAIAPLLQAVIDSMASAAQGRRIAIRVTGTPEQANVRADADRLKQVIGNVLSNAIKYNRDGGYVEIDVAAEPGAWKISIVDSGIGITEQQIPHLYEPFNRLGRASAGTDGVGIGLALTRWLVDRMDGRMSLRSVVGQGTCFEIVLPRAVAVA